jgi:hypothetical protein
LLRAEIPVSPVLVFLTEGLFSVLWVFHRPPVSRRLASMPVYRIAAPEGFSLSVTITSGFSCFRGNSNAVSASRRLVTTASSTAPSWTTARERQADDFARRLEIAKRIDPAHAQSRRNRPRLLKTGFF